MELAGAVRVGFIGGFSSLLLVVASCSGNEIVATNYGVMGAFVASSFGRWFMVPIFIFNINSFRPLSYMCFYIIGSTEWVSDSQ